MSSVYQPPDTSTAPRYTGISTFARSALVLEPTGLDVVVVGVPFDTATSFRPGARFGPAHIRAASVLLRPYHVELGVNVVEALSIGDWGDAPTIPGNAEKTSEIVAEHLRRGLETSGAIPLVLGGDHSILLAELRAHAALHGPVGVVLLDAHADNWDEYWGEKYFHGTPLRRALEEGLIAPERSLLAGMRGPLYGAEDVASPIEMGFQVVRGDGLRALSPDEFGQLVRRRVGDGPTMLSFDIDVLDPAFAPGTGVPEVGGLSTERALDLLRALRGVSFCGFDVVEVSPPYDSPGSITGLAAANVAFELLGLAAVSRLPPRGESPAQSS
ncbi:MAG: agmatinase [Solirubrobacteraceae bacterium]